MGRNTEAIALDSYFVRSRTASTPRPHPPSTRQIQNPHSLYFTCHREGGREGVGDLDGKQKESPGFGGRRSRGTQGEPRRTGRREIIASFHERRFGQPEKWISKTGSLHKLGLVKFLADINGG